MGVKGFKKGHFVSQETRKKISKAMDKNFFAKCDYCGKDTIQQSRITKNQKDIFVVESVIINL